MTLSKTWNNTTYSIPQSGERGWASLTNFLSALADGAQSTGKQLIGRRVATTSPVTITATTDAYVGVNVSAAIAAVSLPAGVAGQVFYITDESGAAATYNITITPNGAETIGGAATYVLNANNQAIGIVYSGSDWKLFANFTPIAVTPSSTTTFTNKKLVDNSVTFVDNGDNTKQFAVEVSGVTTGTTRTWTVPNSNDTFVGKATTDILTNKTLTSPTISGSPAISGATITTSTLNGNTATNLISGSGTIVHNTSGTATVTNNTGTIPALSYAAVASATTINAMASTARVIELTGSTATTLNGITAGYLGQKITIINNAGIAVLVNNQSASASAGNKILVPGQAYTMPASVITAASFIYVTISGTNFWQLVDTPAAQYTIGQINGNAPTASCIGEQIRSAISAGSAVSAAATTTAKDLTSISLSAGVWDISTLVVCTLNSATQTSWASGIGTVTGNDLTGTTTGDNYVASIPAPTTLTNSPVTIPTWRVTISTTTIYYVKILATFAAGTPQFFGRISATRVG